MNLTKTNRAAAIRFIDAFNTAAWDNLPAVVADDFVLHHPMGGTMRLGPQGMHQVWAHFKAALPDAWHPIPIMIAEGDYVATLLPTYGTFNGDPHQGIPPTGQWLEYGMVNIVRLEGGKLVVRPADFRVRQPSLEDVFETRRSGIDRFVLPRGRLDLQRDVAVRGMAANHDDCRGQCVLRLLLCYHKGIDD